MNELKVDTSGMEQIYLYRTVYSKVGVFGMLVHELPVAVTAERPWLFNKKNESCIPSGKYVCKIQDHISSSGASYRCPEITGVPGRTNIEIHIGNDPMTDSTGCVLIGTEAAGGRILGSTKGLAKLMDIVGESNFILVIIDVVGYEKCLPTNRKINTWLPGKWGKRVPAIMIPKVQMNAMDKDSSTPDYKLDFKTKLISFWWKLRPFVAPILSATGAIVSIFNPAIGKIVAATGAISGKLKGPEAVAKDANIKAWEKVVDAIMKFLKWLFSRPAK